MSERIDIAIATVQREIDELRLTYPEVQDEDGLWTDMLEGSTSLHDILSVLVAQARQARADAAAVRAMIEAYVKPLRKQIERHERRFEVRKALIMRLMDRADVKKVALPEAPLGISRTVPKAHIINPEELPDEYWRVKREPMLREIGELLRHGKDIPGAVLGNPGQALRGL